MRAGTGGTASSAEVELGPVAGGVWAGGGPQRASLTGNRLRVTAVDPGVWSVGTRVEVTYRAYGPTGEPEFDVRIVVPGEAPIHRTGIAPDALTAAIDASLLLTAALDGDAAAPSALAGPAVRSWQLVLDHGADPAVDVGAYDRALLAQQQIEEVALVALPGSAERLAVGALDVVVSRAAALAAGGQDRLVLLGVDAASIGDMSAWQARMVAALPTPAQRRSVAAYGPWLRAEDPRALSGERYADVDPTGHVAGVIARLDRERGSGWSPANVLVADCVDVSHGWGATEQQAARANRLNILRCRTGGGIEIWCADTQDAGSGRFVAHRRLIHRIVRASRRVAAPLVFDTNGRILWFTVARAVSGVLMEAFRSGQLAGETPDQAYRVRCDESTMTADQIDVGQVVCEIEVAPAVPMEFITLRLTIGAEGLLEVVEQ